MTSMPQLVSLFNAVGGGAAALIAAGDAVSHAGSQPLAQLPIRTTLTTTLDLIIGGVTFSGSLVAGGKLAGHIPGRPMSFPGGRALNAVLAVVAAGYRHHLHRRLRRRSGARRADPRGARARHPRDAADRRR